MARQLSYESKVELARLRANIRLNTNAFRFPVVEEEASWVAGITEPEDVGIQTTPQVAVAAGAAYLVEPVRIHRCGIGFSELLTIEPTHPKFAPKDATRIRAGFRKVRVEANEAALQTLQAMNDEEFRYVHRDQDDNEILRRWNQPDDVLDELDAIEQAEEREVWVERMTAFRETQLRSLLRQYFQSDRYMDREIVLKWEQKDGRWVPAQKMLVRDWVAQQIETRGSRLAGFSACAGTIRSKLTRKRISQDATGQSGGSWWKTYNKVV